MSTFSIFLGEISFILIYQYLRWMGGGRLPIYGDFMEKWTQFQVKLIKTSDRALYSVLVSYADRASKCMEVFFLSKGLVPVLHEFIGKAIYNKPPIFWMVYTKHFMVKFGMADPMVLPTFVHWSIAPWGLLNDLTIVWWGVPKSANPGMSYKLHMCLPLKQIKRLIYADTTHTHKDH